MSTIVILTALPLEQDAVLQAFKIKTTETFTHPTTGTVYYASVRSLHGRDVTIVVGCTNQTNVNAAVETERAINFFKPSHIFFVGVAGGLKDVAVGDLVIGDEVVGYERAKVETEYKPRFQYGASSYDMEQAAMAFSRTDNWRKHSDELLNSSFHTQLHVFSGVIASGEKVVADEQAALYKLIRKDISHALAVEMEGLGFLKACRAYPEVKSLVIRGISDLINDKGETDSMGSQPYAARNASVFISAFIEQLSLAQLLATGEQSPREQIFEIACKIYPRGLDDKGIWIRADGDLSVVNLNGSAKSQWAEALRLIAHGGGGGITFSKLLIEMERDASANESIKTLKGMAQKGVVFN